MPLLATIVRIVRSIPDPIFRVLCLPMLVAWLNLSILRNMLPSSTFESTYSGQQNCRNVTGIRRDRFGSEDVTVPAPEATDRRGHLSDGMFEADRQSHVFSGPRVKNRAYCSAERPIFSPKLHL